MKKKEELERGMTILTLLVKRYARITRHHHWRFIVLQILILVSSLPRRLAVFKMFKVLIKFLATKKK